MRDRDKQRRYNRKYAAKVRARDPTADNKKKRDQQRSRDPNIRREQRQEKEHRHRKGTCEDLRGMNLRTPFQDRRPRITFIDAHGAVHLEDYLSAEELIARYEN